MVNGFKGCPTLPILQFFYNILLHFSERFEPPPHPFKCLVENSLRIYAITIGLYEFCMFYEPRYANPLLLNIVLLCIIYFYA